jgi:cysteine desulfurase
MAISSQLKERSVMAEIVPLSEGQPDVAYFDNNATTRPLPEVVDAMVEILGARFGNASSAHSGGEEARTALAKARSSVAELLDADSEQIVFTSSGTEANNMALLSGLGGNRGLITSTIEHSSIVQMAIHLEGQGISVCRLNPNRAGVVTVTSVAQAIAETKPALVSIQWVNSETGVIQPVSEIAEICREAGVLFHTDAAQAVGKLPVSASSIDADFVTCTAHKFHGPAGIGVVYAKDPKFLVPVFHGGDQEHGVRAGTENLAGIVGTGVAATIRRNSLDTVVQDLARIRDEFEERLQSEFPWIEINGGSESRVCNTSNLHFPSLDGQALVAQFDGAGIQCSQSSACTNLRPEPSYVLRAMGLSEKEAYASVRFSFGVFNSVSEVAEATGRMMPIIQRLSELLR